MRLVGPLPWTIDNAKALRPAFGDAEDLMREKVLSQDAQLWRVDNVSYLCTEIQPDELFVWCFVGERFFDVSVGLARIALDNKLSRLGWFTRHKAPHRVYRKFAPTIAETTVSGEFRFSLDCMELLRHGKYAHDIELQRSNGSSNFRSQCHYAGHFRRGSRGRIDTDCTTARGTATEYGSASLPGQVSA